MEKPRLTYNYLSSSNLTQSEIKRKNTLKSSQNSNIIMHYKLIKNIRSGKSNKHKQKVTSNSVYINKDILKKKFKLIYYFPQRRINSTKINSELLYKKLNFASLGQNDSFNDNDTLNKRKKIPKKLNAYYYSANLPIKNKYIVDSLSQEKPKTMRDEGKSKVSIMQKKIDNLAKNLNLFQYKKKSNNLKNVKNPLRRKVEKINKREFIQSYNSKQNEFSNNTKSTIPSKIMQLSSLEKTNYSKISQRSAPKIIKENTNLSSNKEISEKIDIIEGNKADDSKENDDSKKIILDKIKEENVKKIMKNAQTSAKALEAKDEFLYKKIFHFNNIHRKKKTINVIDNKLNIFYSDNIFQYNQKMSRINDMLTKRGKPRIHQGVERNSQKNMENMIQKVQFIKKIVDYVYPNMVLYKVKQEKKRLSQIKSLDFKFSRSQLNLLNLRNEQRKLDSYFRKSVVINKF